MDKKELKSQALKNLEEDRNLIKDLKSQDDKTKLKEAKKEIKTKYKQEIKNEEDEAKKKELKKQYRYYKAKKKQPRRLITLGVVVVIILFIYSMISPILSEVSSIMDNEFSLDTPEAIAARDNGTEVAKRITDEGLVLLKNDDDLLPLASDAKINVFGYGAMDYKMGGGGSGATNLENAVSIYEGLDNAGIDYNKDLYNFYSDLIGEVDNSSQNIWLQMAGAILGVEEESEPETTDYITTDVMDQAKDYSDTAMVVLTSMGTEASDATADQLQLSPAERNLLDTVTQNFDNVIVLVNSGYAMDLTYLDEYPQIKAAIWIGNPGAYGADSIAKTLNGELNPSGRLTDTYLKVIENDPAIQNIGDYTYDNLDGISRLDYEEGIYVGYRYYETKYLDDEAGYNDAVMYPFGYGLSYTDFNQEIVSKNITSDTISVDVKVTNTGDVAGKDVVQLYFAPPYYEGGLEKSAIELAAFDKTDILEPGKSQTLTLTFDIKDMSSWDSIDNQAYVLDKGDYEIILGENVHDQIDSFTYKVKDTIVYTEDEDTGYAYENQFDYATGDDLTYMSRTDFDGTFPSSSDINLTASQEVIDDFYAQDEEIEGTEATTNANNDIMLEDLYGLDKNDPMWDSYLDQFSIDEMIKLVSYGGWHTEAIDRLGVPRTTLLDGPAGWNAMFGPKVDAASYPSELLLASSWNIDLAYELGDAIGQEGKAYGIDMWYAPAMNIHRSPVGGRNWEYLSEDPLLSGYMAANMVNGAQDNGVMVTIKHFILNDQEINARSGVIVWANEQSIRELYLKPFEIATKESNPTGAMSSFINIGTKWAGGNTYLLNNVLRGEWGFEGIVSTDAQLGSWMNPVDAVVNGNELMLSMFKGASNTELLEEAYKEKPVLISNSLRDRTHQILYTILNESNAVIEQ